jgi:hypothetical protein
MHILTFVRKCERMNEMNGSQLKTTTTGKKYVSGYKVIEVNVTEPTENVYAVVTPVKIRD